MSNHSISQLMTQYSLGAAYCIHNGVSCYPATEKETGNRYIAKIYSYPSKQATTDAFLVCGAFPNLEKINAYYREQVRELCKQVAILNGLSHLEHFSHITHYFTEPKSDIGYDVCILSPYRHTLAELFQKINLQRDTVIELGLQLCQGLLSCREAGFMYIGLKPENIFISPNGRFQIGDIGFIPLSAISYTALPFHYQTIYTPPESHDIFQAMSDTTDVYSVGAILYQAVCGGKRPSSLTKSPQNADQPLTNIIMQACDPTPTKRFRNPQELYDALISVK